MMLTGLARQEKTCGLSQWRLPTERTRHINQPYTTSGLAGYRHGLFPYTKRSDYWTADNRQPLEGGYRFLGQGAITINFIKGKKTATPYRNAAYVRLVTDEQK